MQFDSRLLCLLGVLLCLAPGGGAEDPLYQESKEDSGFKIETTFMPKKECERKSVTSDMLSMHYTGIIAKSGKQFDSSRDRPEPFKFQLGVGQVIKGWDLGLRDMCVGEQRKLTIPPQYGYGDKGAGEKIPPGATLIFEVELLDIEDGHKPETIFNEIDKDSDGRLSKKEFQTYQAADDAKDGVSEIRPADLQTFISVVFELEDHDGDGWVSLAEFLSTVYEPLEKELAKGPDKDKGMQISPTDSEADIALSEELKPK